VEAGGDYFKWGIVGQVKIEDKP